MARAGPACRRQVPGYVPGTSGLRRAVERASTWQTRAVSVLLTVLSAIAALLAAVAYGVASVLQSVAGRAAGNQLDVRGLARVFSAWPYLLGLVLDGVGFCAALVALRSLPLFLVQAAVAANIGVTALVAVRWLGLRLRRSDRLALWTMGAGLVLLAVSAAPETARPLPAPGRWLVLAAVALPAALALWAVRWPAARAAVGLAVVAGLGFGGVAVAARTVQIPHPWWHVIGSPLASALVASSVVGLVGYAAALQRGAVTVVAAVALAIETLVPAAVGLIWLGDRARSGLWPLAAVGFVTILVAAMTLARSAELVQPPSGDEQPGASPDGVGGEGLGEGSTSGSRAVG